MGSKQGVTRASSPARQAELLPPSQNKYPHTKSPGRRLTRFSHMSGAWVILLLGVFPSRRSNCMRLHTVSDWSVPRVGCHFAQPYRVGAFMIPGSPRQPSSRGNTSPMHLTRDCPKLLSPDCTACYRILPGYQSSRISTTLTTTWMESLITKTKQNE